MLPLLVDPPLQGGEKGSNHVELVGADGGVVVGFLDMLAAALVVVVVVAVRRQAGQAVELNLADLLAGLRLEDCVERDAAEDKHAQVLLSHGDVDRVDVAVVGDEAGFLDVVARLLPDFSYGADKVILVLVDLASGEGPGRVLLPALDEEDLVHVVVEQDGASDGDAGLVGHELVEGQGVEVVRVAGGEGAVLQDARGKLPQVQLRQRRVQRTDKVFVEPLGLLDLEADSLDRLEFFLGQVDDKTDAQVI